MVVHSDLLYPEGVAASEILKVGETSGNASSGVRELLKGSGIAGLISLCTSGFQVLASGLSLWFNFGKATTQFALGYSTALLGAGYLIGITSGLAMLVGIILAWGIFIPYFTSTGAPADGQILQQFAQFCYTEKVRLIGAGAMGVAAVWTLIKLMRPFIDGVKESIQLAKIPSDKQKNSRTNLDMSIKSILAVFFVMLAGLLGNFYSFISATGLPFAQELLFTFAGVFLALFIGFLIAAACAYMAGLVGTSSSPISGIAILAIIISSLVIMAICNSLGIFDITGGEKLATATAIFTTSIVLAIACISNDNMQDLKTGFLVNATPRNQQIALILGCIIGALVIAPVLNILYQAYGFTGALPRPDMNPEEALAAPQATLMTMIAQGIFSNNLAGNIFTAELAWAS